MPCDENKKRLIYIDIIKIFAILGVILIHVCSQHWYNIPIISSKWEAMNLWNAIGRFGVPVFVMCSGVLFLNKKELSYKDLFCKYIFRILIVFFVWILIYAFIREKYDIVKALLFFKRGIPKVHLWFLIMILGIYLITPIIRIFIKNASKKDIEYFLIIAFIIQSIIPFLIDFEMFKWIKNYYKHLYPAVVSGYVGYFVLGYYLNKYELTRNKKIDLILLGIISVISTIMLNLLRARQLNEPKTIFFDPFYPNIVLYSIGIFIAIKEICNKIKFKEKAKKFISEIGKNVLGIYLIHMVIREILNSFNINSLMYNAYISIPITALLIFVISLVITYIISKIPIIRKIVL